jgi:hypothetical protein
MYQSTFADALELLRHFFEDMRLNDIAFLVSGETVNTKTTFHARSQFRDLVLKPSERLHEALK